MENWTLVLDKTEHPIPVESMDGTLYFQLEAIALALNARLTPVTRDRTILRMDWQGHTILLNTDQRVYSMNGQTRFLEHPIRRINARLWVPEEWLLDVGSTVFGHPPVFNRTGRKILLSTDRMVPIRIEYQEQATLSRVIFHSPQPIVFQLTERPNGVHVRLDRPTAYFTNEPSNVRGPRLKGIRRVPDRSGNPSFMMLFDPDKVRYRAYTLENPFRFVIEFFEPHNQPESQPGELRAPENRPASTVRETAPASMNEFDVVVIDPGHGGEETGTVGPSGTYEKDITLAIARRLKRYLEARLGLKVYLTREDDRTLSLDERTAKANEYHADLFISIHANAALRGVARGAETYYLSVDWVDEESRKRLNQVEPGAFRSESGEGDVLDLILWDMAQTAYIEESSRFARLIQSTLNEELGLSDRGVKQAPFRVLMGARMPAVLVEVGFLDNPQEEQRLKDPAYQERLALAMYRSIERYVQTVRGLYSPRMFPERDTGGNNPR